MQSKRIIFSCKMWLQDCKSESESIWSLAYNISKRGIPLHKVQITNNTNDEKALSLPYNNKRW